MPPLTCSTWFKGFGALPSIFLLYGLPVSVVSFLFGPAILQKAFGNTGRALRVALGLFGVFSLSGLVVATLILTLILSFDPKAAHLLQRPNPVLHIPHQFAWIMVWHSIVLVGPTEEYLFRGFVYGGLLSLLEPGTSWAWRSSRRHCLPWLIFTMPWCTGSLPGPCLPNYCS